MKRRGLAVLVLGVAVLLMADMCSVGPDPIITACETVGFAPSPWYGRAPLSVCMTGRMSEGGAVLNYAWDFGDGSYGSGETVTHTYTTVGDYTVTMTCTYASGQVASDYATISVAGEPVATFTATEYRPFNIAVLFGFAQPSDEEVLEYKFDGRDSYPQESETSLYVPVQIVWDFGDGTVETVPIDNQVPWIFWFGAYSEFVIRHTFPAAGVYTVSMTLTDNLGYSDTDTQTIVVGIPTPDDGDDVAEQFTLTSSDWDVDEEEEGGCLAIYGSVANNGPLDAGVELTATAYAGAVAVGSITHWVAGATNISAGVDYAYSFFLCDLSVPAEQVTSLEVVVSDAVVY